MWSDPSDLPGVRSSPRNVGICFGPDVTAEFLAVNGLSTLIRSHECVPAGTQVRCPLRPCCCVVSTMCSPTPNLFHGFLDTVTVLNVCCIVDKGYLSSSTAVSSLNDCLCCRCL